MAQDRYGLYPCVLNGAINVQQIDQVNVRSGVNREVIVPSGNIDPSAVILSLADPVVEFESGDVATILGSVSPTAGLACPSGATFQFQQRADGGTFTGGTTNVKIASTVGFVYPKTLSARQDQGAAKLTLAYVAKWDGTNDPLAVTAAVALTSSPAFNARFFLGPVYDSATPTPNLIPGVDGWSLDFGLEYKTKRLDGDPYPRVGSIFSRKPKFTFDLLKADYAATIASLFNAAPAHPVSFYLRKGVAGGARVADATAQHIKLVMATGAWNADSFSVQGENDTTVTVACEATGTITFTSASAIP